MGKEREGGGEESMKFGMEKERNGRKLEIGKGKGREESWKLKIGKGRGGE